MLIRSDQWFNRAALPKLWVWIPSTVVWIWALLPALTVMAPNIPEAPLFIGASGGLFQPTGLRMAPISLHKAHPGLGSQRFLWAVLRPTEASRMGCWAGRDFQNK